MAAVTTYTCDRCEQPTDGHGFVEVAVSLLGRTRRFHLCRPCTHEVGATAGEHEAVVRQLLYAIARAIATMPEPPEKPTYTVQLGGVQ